MMVKGSTAASLESDQYESRNNCPCSNELISQMHNNIPQCLDANTPLMCFPVSTYYNISE